MMAMRCWQMGLVGVAAALVNGPANAQLKLITDCSQLSVRLEGIPEAANARCDGDENGSLETIDASGPAMVFFIRHQFTEGGTYFWRLKAAEIIKRLPESGRAESQGEEFVVENFNVMRYRATTSGRESPAACFAFAAYAGHVDHSTGYRHSVVGIYCDLAGSEATDARIRELLGGIEADFW